MKQFYFVVFAILFSTSLIFSADCDSIRNEINNKKILQIVEYGLLGISITGLGFSNFYTTGSTPRFQSESYLKTKKIMYGITIVCVISLPFEIISVIRTHKKISKLNNTLELNCTKNLENK